MIGDLILDRYIDGSANRVSPEAPVLVFEAQAERTLLGGACNVAANLQALGASASVMGVVGSDGAGRQLLELLKEEGIDTSAVFQDESRPTIRKTRYVSKTAQILRVDEERRHPIGSAVLRQMLDFLGVRPLAYDAILISDYGKGVVAREVVEAAVAAAKGRGAITVVDPKGKDYSMYRGVDLLTPNREEAELATGLKIATLDDLPKVASRLREITGVKTATVTLGKDGIFYETEKHEPHVIPTEARQVFDVTGAGDTVVAVLTYARAAGIALPEALRLANLGAGITVGHRGTWAVSREELLAVLGARGPGKVLAREEAVAIAARLRTEGKRLVFTNGCFDLLHPGHCEYLTKARTYGDALMVGVNTDESVRRQGKGAERPINALEDRMDVLAALQAVDFVVPFGEDTPEQLIRAVTPHALVKGEDWRHKGVVGRDWVESHGGQVVLVALKAGKSTTAIVERILKGARPG